MRLNTLTHVLKVLYLWLLSNHETKHANTHAQSVVFVIAEQS